jgi:hypothetical protein
LFVFGRLILLFGELNFLISFFVDEFRYDAFSVNSKFFYLILLFAELNFLISFFVDEFRYDAFSVNSFGSSIFSIGSHKHK